MSKKKHPEHVNHERWLVSYADFITLLFAFFVVLFASSQSDKKKQTQLAAAMQAAFSPPSIFEPHAKRPSLTETAAGASAQPVAPPVPSPSSVERSVPMLRKLLADQTRSAKLPPGSLVMHTTSEGIVISLQEAGFFTSGSAEVQPRAKQVLIALAAALPTAPLRVEGHTDALPIHTEQFATNWELSSGRATSIARYLFEHGPVNPADISVTGYAEYHPIASNATEEGRAKNRRVDIILLSRPVPSQ